MVNPILTLSGSPFAAWQNFQEAWSLYQNTKGGTDPLPELVKFSLNIAFWIGLIIIAVLLLIKLWRWLKEHILGEDVSLMRLIS